MIGSKVRATTKQNGTVRLAKDGEVGPNLAVRADDPRLSPGGGGGGIRVVSTLPPSNTGTLGETVFCQDTLAMHHKSAPIGWVFMGKLMMDVTDAQIFVKTPTAGTGSVRITT